MADASLGAYNIEDLREIARRRLPHGVFEYLDRGTEDDVSLRNNRTAFERIGLRPRVLVDVSKRSQEVTLFGQSIKMPVVIGPTGFGGLCAYQGEVALAKAAAAAEVPYVLGAASLTAMEKVMDQSEGARLWFQITMWPDRELCHTLVERARVAGFQALVVLVDAAVLGNREYNRRNGFTIPFQLTWRSAFDLLHFHWLCGVILPYVLREGGLPSHDNYPEELGRRLTSGRTSAGRKRTRTDSLSWDDLRALRKVWPHPLIVKGILSPRDAILAADCGADGIIVSNHGGRNLDGAITPISVLPEIVDVVGNRLTVLIDSGFRRGSDVVKALALGAKAVLLGRAPLYGLSVAGQAGVTRSLEIFRDEIDRVMALLGCNSVAELNPELVSRNR